MTRGLDDPDFDKAVSKEELGRMLRSQKYDFPQEEFDLIYDLARRKSLELGYQSDEVTYKSFLEVMRNLKRGYLRYRNLFRKENTFE